jgi:hypothetical protein
MKTRLLNPPFTVPLTWALALFLTISASGATSVSSLIGYPTDSGVINVQNAVYNWDHDNNPATAQIPAPQAQGDGVTDDSLALQAALQTYAGTGRIIYLPNGTYKVSRTIWFGSQTGLASGGGWRNVSLQGETESGTIIKLADNLTGFSGAGPTVAVVQTAPPSGDASDPAFYNAANSIGIHVRNLTIDIGSGNTRAVALRFMGNNSATLLNVTLKSSDVFGRGAIGLDLAFNILNGPALIRDLTVTGFSNGIVAGQSTAQHNFVLENILLDRQSQIALTNGGAMLSVRNLTVSNEAGVGGPPAITNSGTLVLLGKSGETTFSATGTSPVNPAIRNNTTGVLYARDVSRSGYASLIENLGGTLVGVAGTSAAEFVSHPISTQFADSGGSSLKIHVQDSPGVMSSDLVPWSLNYSTEWANVRSYGAVGNSNGAPGNGTDDTAAIQSAMNSNRSVVYFPPSSGYYRIAGTVTVPASVKRIVTTGGSVTGGGTIQVTGGSFGDATIIELPVGGGGAFYPSRAHFVLSSNRTTVLSTNNADVTVNGQGKLFLDNYAGHGLTLNAAGQQTWARQLDTEIQQSTNIINNGADLWILGYKSENGNVKIETMRNGAIAGRTELLGAHLYLTAAGPIGQEGWDDFSTSYYGAGYPAVASSDALASYIGLRDTGTGTPTPHYTELVEETRGATTNVLLGANAPLVGAARRQIPFYSAARPATILYPYADAKVSSSSPTSNYGTLTDLQASRSATTAQYIYLKFSLAGVTGTIVNAKLHLSRQESVSIASGTYLTPGVYSAATDTWGETTINWNNRPTLVATLRQWAVIDEKEKFADLEVDVSSQTITEFAGDKVLTLCIALDGNSRGSLEFGSRESTLKPYLRIQTQ